VQNETFDYLLARELKNSLGDLPMELSPTEEEGMRENPQTDPGLAVGRMVWRDYRDGGVLDRLMKELQNLRLARKQGTPGDLEPVPDSVKQSQLPAGGQETGTDCAKQSQAAADGAPCETKPIAPAGVVARDSRTGKNTVACPAVARL
jgi:hypothetical protein